MIWAWKSIARGRARLDDVIPDPMQDASLATWQPRRAENASRLKPKRLRPKAKRSRLSSTTRYVAIVSCARARGQKKRAPRIGRRAAPGFAGRVRERAPAREMRRRPLVRAQLDAGGKIIEQIGLQPE